MLVVGGTLAVGAGGRRHVAREPFLALIELHRLGEPHQRKRGAHEKQGMSSIRSGVCMRSFLTTPPHGIPIT
jgi:hypothetical protein